MREDIYMARTAFLLSFGVRAPDEVVSWFGVLEAVIRKKLSLLLKSVLFLGWGGVWGSGEVPPRAAGVMCHPLGGL